MTSDDHVRRARDKWLASVEREYARLLCLNEPYLSESQHASKLRELMKPHMELERKRAGAETVEDAERWWRNRIAEEQPALAAQKVNGTCPGNVGVTGPRPRYGGGGGAQDGPRDDVYVCPTLIPANARMVRAKLQMEAGEVVGSMIEWTEPADVEHIQIDNQPCATISHLWTVDQLVESLMDRLERDGAAHKSSLHDVIVMVTGRKE